MESLCIIFAINNFLLRIIIHSFLLLSDTKFIVYNDEFQGLKLFSFAYFKAFWGIFKGIFNLLTVRACNVISNNLFIKIKKNFIKKSPDILLKNLLIFAIRARQLCVWEKQRICLKNFTLK